ncbi:MAG: nucleotidyltransferase domain-containing protein [Candidatus Micrarchaeota archaeon]
MITEWSRFRGWTILEHFLLYPDKRVHINALARVLKIGPSTAQAFCSSYHKDGLLGKEVAGNTHLYFLDKDDARVRALRAFIGPYLISDFLPPFLAKNKGVLSISIYGSFSSGDYGDGSDIDILIITASEERPDTAPLRGISLRLGRDANITPISLAKWRRMERDKEPFFQSIKKNSISIWGNPI